MLEKAVGKGTKPVDIKVARSPATPEVPWDVYAKEAIEQAGLPEIDEKDVNPNEWHRSNAQIIASFGENRQMLTRALKLLNPNLTSIQKRECLSYVTWQMDEYKSIEQEWKELDPDIQVFIAR